MALQKILKNQSGGLLQILNRNIDNGSQYAVPYQFWLDLAEDTSIDSLIQSGNIVVNDGTSDLSISEALELIKRFQFDSAEKITFDNSNNGFISTDTQNAIEEARIFNVKYKTVLLEDFLGIQNGQTYGWTLSTSNNSSGVRQIDSLQNRPGIIQLYKAQGFLQPTGVSSLSLGSTSILLGGGETVFTAAVRVPTIPSASQDFKIEIGFGNSFSSGDSTNFVGFAFNRGLSTTNWFAVTGTSGTYTTLNSSTTMLANTWYTLRAVINATKTSIEFFINESSIGTITTNIPSSQIAPILKITQVSGASERQMDVDYYELQKEFTTAR